ncbi:hypothetical protein IAQ61_001684, partial [Plenodomus lingam]|uniref:uncharacterized protein n=1 Tax=Leptosphaeria maculans TaxID=5022 RepID=UPI00331D7D1A
MPMDGRSKDGHSVNEGLNSRPMERERAITAGAHPRFLQSIDDAHSSSTPASVNDEESSKQMLAEMYETSTASSPEQERHVLQSIVTKLKHELSSTRQDISDDQHDLHEVRRQLCKVRGSSSTLCNERPNISAVYLTVLNSTQTNSMGSSNESARDLLQECIAHIVALIVASLDGDDEVTKAGMRTYIALTYLVQRTAQKPGDLFQTVIQARDRDRVAEEKESLLFRLLISNVAADAQEVDLLVFFCSHSSHWNEMQVPQAKFDISQLTVSFSREIKFWKYRHPTEGTKMAQVDMWTRRVAVMASWMSGSILGLNLDTKLATDLAK